MRIAGRILRARRAGGAPASTPLLDAGMCTLVHVHSTMYYPYKRIPAVLCHFRELLVLRQSAHDIRGHKCRPGRKALTQPCAVPGTVVSSDEVTSPLSHTRGSASRDLRNLINVYIVHITNYQGISGSFADALSSRKTWPQKGQQVFCPALTMHQTIAP